VNPIITKPATYNRIKKKSVPVFSLHTLLFVLYRNHESRAFHYSLWYSLVSFTQLLSSCNTAFFPLFRLTKFFFFLFSSCCNVSLSAFLLLQCLLFSQILSSFLVLSVLSFCNVFFYRSPPLKMPFFLPIYLLSHCLYLFSPLAMFFCVSIFLLFQCLFPSLSPLVFLSLFSVSSSCKAFLSLRIAPLYHKISLHLCSFHLQLRTAYVTLTQLSSDF
jgi:hypothetical protein